VSEETDSLLLEEQDVQEEFFSRGFTDGLPVVPPTPQRVAAMLEVLGDQDAETLIGYLPVRGRGVSLRKAAINAVMAGCRPSHFPVVIAALEAMFDTDFNLHTVLTSTGGAALCTVVSGPIANEIGMASRHSVLGPGNRANATIGRALRLIAINVLGSRPGESDASSFGHPGKYTFCFAEDPPPAPWQPLHVQLGYRPDDTTVTVLPSEGPHQVAQQVSRSAMDFLRTFASAIANPYTFSTGKGGQGLAIFGPEHARFCIEEGLTQSQVKELLYRESRVSEIQLARHGVHIDRNAGFALEPDDDGLLPSVLSPDDIHLITAGGEGAGWSTWVPSWAPAAAARACSRRVRPIGEPLPDCGPDGCIVPWARS
jgi:hypothetical protein